MKRILLMLIVVLGAVSSVSADGILVPRMTSWMPPRPHVNVRYHNVQVTINDPVAKTVVDQAFINPFRQEIEADYIFPIPENAVISGFTAWLNGHKMEAELLDADQARRIYEDIVRRRQDPALLEYSGRGMYRMRVYPIPANGEVRIKIEYNQTLESDGGTVEYIYPLNTEKFSGANLESCQIDVDIASFENIGTVYCPSHDITIERVDDENYRANYIEHDIKPNTDFMLYFTRQKKDFGFHMLSYVEPGKDNGYFLGILSPPSEKNAEMISKNIIFVLDSSGSMRGEKFSQAVAALKFVLLGLGEGDRFNIIDYDDDVRPFQSQMVRASDSNIKDGINFAENLEAGGGTNIYQALARSCSMIDGSDNPTYILFLTDGLPTVGITRIEDIIENTTSQNEGRARLFIFGVGYDVNAHLLDRLALKNNGLAEYVLPEEDIEVKVSNLASKISKPALTDIVLSFDDVDAYKIYPNPMPDLFFGSEIIITGRFDKTVSTDVSVKGRRAGRDVEYTFPVKFNRGKRSDEFIALLWATRRIGDLTQQMRLHGRNQEYLDEVIRLSKKFGIVTEFTSFIVTGDENMRAEDLFSVGNEELADMAFSNIDRGSKQKSGSSAFNQSKALNSQTQSVFNAAPGVAEIGGKKVHFSNLTQVGAQGFVNIKDNWIQSDLKTDKFDMEIKRFSEAYFQILQNDPSLGRYLGLGEQVRLQIGSQIVQISDAGQETLDSEELKLLFP